MVDARFHMWINPKKHAMVGLDRRLELKVAVWAFKGLLRDECRRIRPRSGGMDGATPAMILHRDDREWRFAVSDDSSRTIFNPREPDVYLCGGENGMRKISALVQKLMQE